MSLLIESEIPGVALNEVDGAPVLIRLEGVSVEYRAPRERIGTLKEYAIRLLQRRVRHDVFTALREVSLEIKQGEVFGIIGHNGAGKSTLLKVVSRVLKPTRGRVWVKGRVAPLLELGAGFHAELSGRENIFLNGTLLGYTHAEMEAMFDRIVDFAEVWDFIDAPLRTYSTGMAARLGFAVATATQPDILIVDEVLSVGDERFQEKCAARMKEFREGGASIMLVTHSPTLVEKMCDRVAWLDRGEVRAIDQPKVIINQYHETYTTKPVSETAPTPPAEQPSADSSQEPMTPAEETPEKHSSFRPALKVLSIFGTRPEAIKMAPVVKELSKHSGQLTSVVCVTAQHREMLDQVLSLFDIKPDYDLNIMQENQSLAEVTANALIRLDEVLRKEKPDWVLVQGDTTTAMVGALAAFYHRVKVGHVEAGLRTWNKFHPFPEEINRKIADAVCDLHFAPTGMARENLLREAVSDASIIVTGNTVIDALLDVAARDYDWSLGQLAAVPRDKRLILVTAHRRESFGAPFEQICAALKELATSFQDVHIVYPVHLNPNVRRPVFNTLGNLPNVTLLEPLEYLPLVQLLKQAYLVLTDSGGLQEEAPGLGKPVLVMRETTERPEGVAAGTVKLVGTDRETIVRETTRLLQNEAEYERMARAVNPYGDGHASERIVESLKRYLAAS